MSIGKTLCRVGLGLLGAAAVAVIACNGGDKGVTPTEKKPWGGTDATVTKDTTTTKGTAAAKGTATAVDPTVTINGLTWTQKNLDIETPDSWCYYVVACPTCDGGPDYCAIYGRLYTWEAAKSACESLGDSWRLPTMDDWSNLVDYAGGEEVAGKKLKSKSGWDDNGNGTDDYEFSALPGGGRFHYVDGSNFGYAGYLGYWWSSTAQMAGESGKGYSYYMDSNTDYVTEGWLDARYGFSVRCVKGESSPTSIREVERRIH